MLNKKNVYNDVTSGLKSLPAVIYGKINDVLSEFWQYLKQTLFQLIHIA